MERVTFKNQKRLNLMGVLYPSDLGKAVVISHGFAANKGRERMVRLSETLSKENFGVLRFDFGGCGESDEREITVKNQVDDLRSAINFMREKGYNSIGLLGESLGGLTTVLAYDENIKTLILWAPVTKSKTPTIIKNEELGQQLDRDGFIIYKKDGRNFKIPKEYLEERRNVNQKEIMSKIKCPVLIIHGSVDDVAPIGDSKEALKFLSKDSKLEIIEGAPHQYYRKKEHMDKILNLSLNWFKQHL